MEEQDLNSVQGLLQFNQTVLDTDFFMEILGETMERIEVAEALRRSMDDEPKPPPPATAQDLNSIETVKMSVNGRLRGSDACGICMNDFEIGETCSVLSCQHGFHRDCVFKWLKRTNTCPVCRLRVSSQPDRK